MSSPTLKISSGDGDITDMADGKIKKEKLPDLLRAWSKERVVFVPSREKGSTAFEEWDGGDADFVSWYRNTVKPPKELFFPQMEEMFRFRRDENGYHVEPSYPGEKGRVIFGIRPCDARGLSILDMLFKDLYPDPYYLSRRKNSVLIGLGCTRPDDACFCTSMGVDPGESGDVDLMLTDIGDYFLVEVVTDKGRPLLSEAGVVEEVGEGDERKAGEVKEAVRQKVTKKLSLEGIGERLRANFGNCDYWEKVSAKCVSCGICTFLCPTCHCFDINDEAFKKQGARFRNWDSCQFPIYTRMPAENPREERWKRVRNRVHDKFEYYLMEFGVISCVGCGRCVRECPVNWDITQTLNGLPAVEETR
jgi:ferredoxin